MASPPPPPLQQQLDSLHNELDTFYLFWAATLVFSMQLGFALLSAGAVRNKNVQNILLKGTLDACIGAIIWYLLSLPAHTPNRQVSSTHTSLSPSPPTPPPTLYPPPPPPRPPTPHPPRAHATPHATPHADPRPRYLFGYGVAYDADVVDGGHTGHPFIGTGPSNYALSGMIYKPVSNQHGANYIGWFFQYAFAAAAATIVSGAVAERCQLGAYLIYTAAITGFIYPVVVHWAWDPVGFLSPVNADAQTRWLCGMIDFAGSGVVHMTGGFAALIGSAVLGPRIGRFSNDSNLQSCGLVGHSVPLTVSGTFFLWIGWYGFNQGSTMGLRSKAQLAARVGVTTTLSAASAALTGLLLKRGVPEKWGGTGVWNLSHTCNSLLSGLVAITAGCATVEPYGAVAIGCLAAPTYAAASCLMRRLRIDDPLDAFAVHGANGILGIVLVGFFTTEEFSFAFDDNGAREAGVFYGGSGRLLASQICGSLIIAVWVVLTSLALFVSMKASLKQVSNKSQTSHKQVSNKPHTKSCN